MSIQTSTRTDENRLNRRPGSSEHALRCDLCGGECMQKGSYLVLGKYEARMAQCAQCGYVFAIEPIWLAEAYSSPMTRVDMGPVNRCIENTRVAKLLLDLLHKPSGRCLDFGGGYGLFVRRMRDLGYNFFRHDTHCPNLFATGFDDAFPGATHYEMITSFEVLEHLVRPGFLVDRILSFSDSFLFSTFLLPEPVPPFDEWGYFGPEHGQHVSFYTRDSLTSLARQFGKHLVTNGYDLHLITNKRMSNRAFRLLTRRGVAAVYELLFPRSSLLSSDFEEGRRCALARFTSASGVDSGPPTGQACETDR